MTADSERVIANLVRMNPLREAPMKSAIDMLHLRPGSRGLDIGCGIGDQTLLLADATLPDGRVTGLDISWSLLRHARQRAGQSASADRITFEQGDMRALPFAQGTFDWAWSVDCLGYPAHELLPILKGICRIVRPGGVIALLGWTSQQLLPGHAMLEARLNATCSSYASLLEGQPPRAHFQRAIHWLPAAGLVNPTFGTVVGQVQAPLRPEIREGMGLLFEMLWADRISQASDSDIEEYRRLCSPASPDFIGDVPEYCGFFTYTMFTGKVSAAL